MSGKKTIDSTQFLTNDRSNNVSSKPIVKISTNYQILNAEEVEDVVENHHEETETEEERIKKMSAEQYTAYLKEKNENPLTKTFKTIAKGIGALVTSPMNLFDSNGIIDSIRSEVLANKVHLDQSPQLSLVTDLKCKTIREAFSKYSKEYKKYLFKCREINVENMIAEGITVDDLKEYKFTLSDVRDGFKIRWSDLCNKFQLKAFHLSREDGWFDTRVISDYVSKERGDLIVDIQFNIDDIRRLKCADMEISKFELNFDILIEKGFTKVDLLEFPWYPDTMADILDLRKEHLSTKKGCLNLNKHDYEFLFNNRGWTSEFLSDKLMMKQDIIDKIVTFIQERKAKPQPIESRVNYIDKVRQQCQSKPPSITLHSLYSKEQQFALPKEDTDDENSADKQNIIFDSSQEVFNNNSGDSNNIPFVVSNSSSLKVSEYAMKLQQAAIDSYDSPDNYFGKSTHISSQKSNKEFKNQNEQQKYVEKQVVVSKKQQKKTKNRNDDDDDSNKNSDEQNDNIIYVDSIDQFKKLNGNMELNASM